MTAAAALAARTVLVADDTAFVRDRFKAAIEGGGYSAITVRTGPELLARVRDRARQVDLVVLDLRLPQGRGLALLHALRDLDRSTAVVIFSGTIASAEEVRQLDTLGVAGYVNEYTADQHILPSLVPHLSPERANRRSGPRVGLGITASYRFANTIAAAVTCNVGHGGLAVRTTSPLPVDTRLRVRFRLPGDRADIDTEARVAWANHRLGMGLQFTTVTTSDQARIDDYVQSHFFSNRKR